MWSRRSAEQSSRFGVSLAPGRERGGLVRGQFTGLFKQQQLRNRKGGVEVGIV